MFPLHVLQEDIGPNNGCLFFFYLFTNNPDNNYQYIPSVQFSNLAFY